HEARHVPWYYLTGGILGAAYVTTVLVTVRDLGAGGVTAATIAGQLTMAVVIDQLGILGVAKHPIDAARVAGIVLLGVGTYLVVVNAVKPDKAPAASIVVVVMAVAWLVHSWRRIWSGGFSSRPDRERRGF